MAYLLDTNILGRLANAQDARHAVASQAVVTLHRRGEALHVTPQVLIEFRNGATRPTAQNGLGLSAVDAEAQAAGFETAFPLLTETPDIYPAWKALVGGCAGRYRHAGAGHLARCGLPRPCGGAFADVQRRGFRSPGEFWTRPRGGRCHDRVRQPNGWPPATAAVAGWPTVSTG